MSNNCEWIYSWKKRTNEDGEIYTTLTLDIIGNKENQPVYFLKDTESKVVLENGKINYGPFQGCRFIVGEFINNPSRPNDILL
jgi:hypothetical protein